METFISTSLHYTSLVRNWAESWDSERCHRRYTHELEAHTLLANAVGEDFLGGSKGPLLFRAWVIAQLVKCLPTDE